MLSVDEYLASVLDGIATLTPIELPLSSVHGCVLAADVAALPVIAVDFPRFADGRGYSIARLLRDRHEYKGELRAVGDIARDQLYFLHQVGFDAFVLREGKDAQDALASLRDFTDGYQATARNSPW